MTANILTRDRSDGFGNTLEPRQLWPADVSRLHLDHHARLGAAEAASLLLESPGSSFWIPETSEFILVTPWRHRAELATVHTYGAFANEDVLLRAAMDFARDQGRAGFVVVDVHETRNPGFYARHGLVRFEDIVTYEHRRPFNIGGAAVPGGIAFRRVDGEDGGLLRAVHDLDHDAFPWFWWNSQEEFVAYLDYPGVEIWAGIRDHEVVSYVGMTQYRNWAHLDRIATRPDLQGSGIGRAALKFAVETMVKGGGRRVALSTQGNNSRSRGLYQRSGFVRTPVDDYCVFVASFNETLVHSGYQHTPFE